MTSTDFTKIRMVWLDLDDTLIDFHANSRAALTKLYEIRGFDSLWQSAGEWIEAYEGHNIPLWVDYSAALIDRDTLRIERFRRPLSDAGVSDTEARALASELDTQYLDLLAMERRLIPGAMELLERLRLAGYMTGVLSNGFADVQHRKIARAGLADKIDLVVLSDDIGINKPDPRLFAHAQSLTPWPDDPGRHLMIGDNPATDISGALGAGWSAIWYRRNSSGTSVPEGATLVDTLSEIRLPEIQNSSRP